MTKDMIVKAAQEAAARRNEVFALNDLRVDLTARRVWKNGKPRTKFYREVTSKMLRNHFCFV